MRAALSTAAAVALLAVGTLLTTVQAELLVGALEPALDAVSGSRSCSSASIVDRDHRQRGRALLGDRPRRGATR